MSKRVEQKPCESPCIYHIDMETRMGVLEEDMKVVKSNQKDPRVLIAVLGVVGTCFTATAAFAGVVLSPIILAILKSWGLIAAATGAGGG